VAVALSQGGLGATVAHRDADRVTFDVFGDHLVYPLGDDLSDRVEPHPRHVGVTLADGGDLDRLLRVLGDRKLPVLVPPGTPFGGTAAERRRVVPADPSGNVLGSKHHLDPRLLY
jgi:extradiol dioxygenase family protein